MVDDRVHVMIGQFCDEQIVNKDESSLHSETRTSQHLSDENVENKQNMRQKWETADKIICDSSTNARPGI